MQDDRITELEALREETRVKWELQLAKALADAEECRAVLGGVGGGPVEDKIQEQEEGVVQPVEDIMEFLRVKGEPTHQFEIIMAVGDIRKERHPKIPKVYLNVWKSLKWHSDHDAKVVPVEWDGSRLVKTKLKAKRKQPRVKRGTSNRPEFYREPDNLFWLKDKIE